MRYLIYFTRNVYILREICVLMRRIELSIEKIGVNRGCLRRLPCALKVRANDTIEFSCRPEQDSY